MQNGTLGILAPVGVGNLRYRPPGIGARTRTGQARLRDVVSAKDFGATGNGATDDTKALQLAHNTGLRVFYPAGFYKVSDTIIVPDGGAVGAGQSRSIIRSSHLTADTFLCTSSEPVDFRDLRLDTSVTKTDGAAIRVNPAAAATQNFQSTFDNLQIGDMPYGIKLDEASTFFASGCYIYNYLEAGIFVDNVVNPDAGDSTIIGCTLDTTKTTGTRAGILHQRSGGLKIIGNKILRGQYGYSLALQGTVDTSILIIEGNSFELQTLNCIRVNRASSANYSYFMITGNQFNGQDVSGTSATPTLIGFSDSAWKYGIITDNVLQIGQNGGIGIELGSLDGFIIGNNVIFGTTGGVRTGISLGANAINGHVGVNRYDTLTTDLLNASASVISILPTAGVLTYNSAIKSSSPTAGVGYATGAGGAVTQLTDKSTTVVLNKVCGQITTANVILNANTNVLFTLTNSAIVATDIIELNHVSGGTFAAYNLLARAGSGQAFINIRNITAGNLTEPIVIGFTVHKGVTA